MLSLKQNVSRSELLINEVLAEKTMGAENLDFVEFLGVMEALEDKMKEDQLRSQSKKSETPKKKSPKLVQKKNSGKPSSVGSGQFKNSGSREKLSQSQGRMQGDR